MSDFLLQRITKLVKLVTGSSPCYTSTVAACRYPGYANLNLAKLSVVQNEVNHVWSERNIY